MSIVQMKVNIVQIASAHRAGCRHSRDYPAAFHYLHGLCGTQVPTRVRGLVREGYAINIDIHTERNREKRLTDVSRNRCVLRALA